MNIEPRQPCGAVVDGLDLGPLTLETVGTLAGLLAEHGVLIFPGQSVDDATFLAFLRSFGPLTFTKGETPVSGFPDLNIVTNVGRSTPPRSSFHVDTSYVRQPPLYTALRAVTVPAEGGETVFSNQYRAYETLPEALVEELAGALVTHAASGVSLEAGDEQEARHPLFRTHPLSGRTALYLTTPARLRSIEGIEPSRAAELLDTLFQHSIREDNRMVHPWSPGDVVMWDNLAVMHRADHSAVSGDRTLHRGLVADLAAAIA